MDNVLLGFYTFFDKDSLGALWQCFGGKFLEGNLEMGAMKLRT